MGYDSIEIRTGVCENTTFVSADYSEYDKVVAQAKALDRSLYTDLTELDEALAVDVSDKNITEQSVVDVQTKAILNALNALQYKPADYSEVENAKAQIPEDLSVYTDESVSALQETLNAVDYSLHITEQETVDGYAKTITDAVNGLEKKPILPTVPEEPTVPTPTEPSTPEETMQSTAPAESTASPDAQNPNIPKTGGTAQITCTVSLLMLLSACIYITGRKKEKQ